jgi:Helix-hairpin-helix motif
MKPLFYKWYSFFICLLITCYTHAQDSTSAIDMDMQSALESLTEGEDQEPENDELLQQLADYRQHPTNLNQVTAEELGQFPFLSSLQAENFLAYRRLLGPFISLYELQAIPGWDLATIRQILPYVKLQGNSSVNYHLADYFSKGEHTFLIRYGRVIERAKGYLGNSGSHYFGNPDKLMWRYQYRLSHHLNIGLTAEKDAGEQFFHGAQSAGFDFYSAHFFLQNEHYIKALAVGDFTVNMGQGLINWQGFTFGKTALVLNIKKESNILRPYSSAGEVYFYRGTGVTIEKGKWEMTGFVSYKPLDANIDITDTLQNKKIITSFVTSGYHRTAAEIDNRHTTNLFSAGGNICYHGRQWEVGLNFIDHKLSLPVHKRDELYNLFAFAGKSLSDISINYSGTLRNAHFFGETAFSDNKKLATINGMLVSVTPHVSLGMLYRYYDKAYHALYPNGFGEGNTTNNENGFYGALSTTWHRWKLDASMDIFHFPWLKYQVDAPSSGWSNLVQLNYQASSELSFLFRYQDDRKQTNGSISAVTHQLVNTSKQHWRISVLFTPSVKLSFISRIEFSGYNEEQATPESGWLAYLQANFKSNHKWRCNIRLEGFNITGYDARIYTYESDVSYTFSIPFLYHEGFRYYINYDYRINKYFHGCFKWSQTIYNGIKTVGSGLDEIQGHIKSEFNMEVLYQLP